MATGTIQLFPGPFVADSTAPPGLAFSNHAPKLLFATDASESVFFPFVMPADYSSGLTLKVLYSMASATSTADVAISAYVMAVSDGDSQDMDAESYDTINTSGGNVVPGTAGHPDTLSLTLTNADSAAAGDHMRIEFLRDHDDDDDATGDMEVWNVWLEYTTA